MLSLLFFGLKMMLISLGRQNRRKHLILLKNYLSLALVLRAPQAGVPFRLYITTEDKVIGVVLTQEAEGKQHVVTYLSRRLVDAETRYTFVEKLRL
jgi:hypothetical protein